MLQKLANGLAPIPEVLPNIQVHRIHYHPGQIEIANSSAKYKVVACGRRFGKTEFGIDQIVETVLLGFPACYFAPSTNTALEVWESLKRILEPVIVRKSEQQHIIRASTGGYVKLWSYHNNAYERTRGQAYKKIIIDEAALASMSMWEYVVEPMLADYDGETIFLSTPRGRLNWFYELFKRGLDPDWEDYQQFQMPSLMNPNPNVQRFVLSQKKKKSADVYGQEYEAKFTIVSGAIYPTFAEETADGTPANVTALAEYDPAYPVYWSVDDGYTNPRAIGFFQERPMFGIEGCICLFDLHYVTQELAEDAIEACLLKPGDEFQPLPPYPQPEFVYYDPSAPEFAAHCRNRGLATWGAWNNVGEGIKVVRRFILNGAGVRRFFIHPRCRPAIDGMIGYHHPENAADRAPSKGGDPNPVKKDDHTCDCIRYMIATRHANDPD